MMTRVLKYVQYMRFKRNPAFWGVFLSRYGILNLMIFILSVNVNIACSLHQYFFFSNLFFDILKQSKERHYQHTVNWFKIWFIRITSTYYSKLITSHKVQRTTGFYCSPSSKGVFESHCSTGEKYFFFMWNNFKSFQSYIIAIFFPDAFLRCKQFVETTYINRSPGWLLTYWYMFLSVVIYRWYTFEH